MRLCNRNCTKIWVSTSYTEQSITDEDGMETGETKVTYGGIKSVKANVRWVGDMVDRENYGAIEDYTCKIMIEPDNSITEKSVIWLSNPSHNNIIDPPEFIILRVAKASTHTILRTRKVKKDA